MKSFQANLFVGAAIFLGIILLSSMAALDRLPIQGVAGTPEWIPTARIIFYILIIICLPYMYILEGLFLKSLRQRRPMGMQISATMYIFGVAMACTPFSFGIILFSLGASSLEFCFLGILSGFALVVWSLFSIRKQKHWDRPLQSNAEAMN